MITAYDVANVILHVVLISSFIGIFFFTYGSYVEQQVIKSQMDYIVKDMVGDLNNFIPSGSKSTINATIGQIQPPDMSKEDADAQNNNSKLLKQALTVLGIVFAIGMGTTIWMSYHYNFSMKELLKTDLIILGFVALTEFCYLTFIGKNYRSGDPNYVKKALVESLQKYQ